MTVVLVAVGPCKHDLEDLGLFLIFVGSGTTRHRNTTHMHNSTAGFGVQNAEPERASIQVSD